MQIVHIPFTNIIVAANNGAPVRIIGGSGAGGLFLLAQGSSGIKSMADLAKQKGKGLKIGAMRLNTFELMAYRALANAGSSTTTSRWCGSATRCRWPRPSRRRRWTW